MKIKRNAVMLGSNNHEVIQITLDDEDYTLLFRCNENTSDSCCGVISLGCFESEIPLPKDRSKEFADKFVALISNKHGLVTMEFIIGSQGVRYDDNFYNQDVMKALLKHGGFKKGPQFVNPKTKNTIQQIYAVINQP